MTCHRNTDVLEGLPVLNTLASSTLSNAQVTYRRTPCQCGGTLCAHTDAQLFASRGAVSHTTHDWSTLMQTGLNGPQQLLHLLHLHRHLHHHRLHYHRFHHHRFHHCCHLRLLCHHHHICPRRPQKLRDHKNSVEKFI